MFCKTKLRRNVFTVAQLQLLLLILVHSIHAMSAVNTPPPPKTLKVHYADMPFWRAECVRMALFIGDIPFEDCRHATSKDLKAAGKLTFGAMPVLEVDNEQILSQTQAMAVYAAKLAGIHPTEDAWLSAKIDECISGCTDVTDTVGATFRIKSAEEKIAAREALIEKDTGRLRMHLGGLEQICAKNNDAQGYSVGTTLTVADLAIWRLVGWMDSGTLDGIPSKYVTDTFPNLAKLVTAVDANPKVQEWKTKHSKFYNK